MWPHINLLYAETQFCKYLMKLDASWATAICWSENWRQRQKTSLYKIKLLWLSFCKTYLKCRLSQSNTRWAFPDHNQWRKICVRLRFRWRRPGTTCCWGRSWRRPCRQDRMHSTRAATSATLQRVPSSATVLAAARPSTAPTRGRGSWLPRWLLVFDASSSS